MIQLSVNEISGGVDEPQIDIDKKGEFEFQLIKMKTNRWEELRARRLQKYTNTLFGKIYNFF
jgi:hypothetical protein